jgi:hypothetical protein
MGSSVANQKLSFPANKEKKQTINPPIFSKRPYFLGRECRGFDYQTTSKYETIRKIPVKNNDILTIRV